MQDSVNSKAMNAHSLNQEAPRLILPIRLALTRVAQDDPSLLMGENLTHCPILGKAPIALIQLLHDPELLTLRYTGRSIVHPGLADVLHIHVLQYNAVEANGELLFGEVGLGEYRNL